MTRYQRTRVGGTESLTSVSVSTHTFMHCHPSDVVCSQPSNNSGTVSSVVTCHWSDVQERFRDRPILKNNLFLLRCPIVVFPRTLHVHSFFWCSSSEALHRLARNASVQQAQDFQSANFSYHWTDPDFGQPETIQSFFQIPPRKQSFFLAVGGCTYLSKHSPHLVREGSPD